MIINNAPQNEAVVSNVGEIGEFRIRNSAKAFNILSSGLYANKIRAIIRELSCNAVDSHVAAGKRDTPFDVHLPNVLEPWFSIRDYGTGLSHDQVVNIYTTYFESTKTASNEFIGALGLGSKSPFSYTDNFSVVAIQNGVRGVYTAFINDQGVPSIALMASEDTTDPNGVEIKFAVTDRYDFDKFRNEAQRVYTYFKQRPVVSGCAEFKFTDSEYSDENIIPGVHVLKNTNRGSSFAIMGNIAYPIDIPNTDQSLNDIRDMLRCSLVMEFDIGELDFQASREGLSYVPQTIDSIKKKLAALNAKLFEYVQDQADKIDNKWERAYFIYQRAKEPLWKEAVAKYIADNKFELAPQAYSNCHTMKFMVDDLRDKYNIVIRQFSKSSYHMACENKKPNSAFDDNKVIKLYWSVSVDQGTHFIVNDTNVGCTERAKYHYRKDKAHLLGNQTIQAIIIEPAVRNKPVKTKEFFEDLYSPPANQMFKASQLSQKDKTGGMGKNVSILKLESRERNWRNYTYVWADAGKFGSFDTTQTYYYLPLSGYQSLGIASDVKQLREDLDKSGVFDGIIYGVRKGDIESIKAEKNWVNLDTFIKEKLNKIDDKQLLGMVKNAIDSNAFFKYDLKKYIIDKNSPYLEFVSKFDGAKDAGRNRQYALERLCKQYGVSSAKIDPAELIKKYQKEAEKIKSRYPLMEHLSYGADDKHVAEYINAIDITKEI